MVFFGHSQILFLNEIIVIEAQIYHYILEKNPGMICEKFWNQFLSSKSNHKTNFIIEMYCLQYDCFLYMFFMKIEKKIEYGFIKKASITHFPFRMYLQLSLESNALTLILVGAKDLAPL